MTRRKTHEEFIKQVYTLRGNAYEVLGIYQKSHTKIKMKHMECNTIYEVTPANFLNGQRCPNCYRNTRKTDEYFKDEIYELVGDEYTVLEPYVNGKTKLLFKHKICNSTWKVLPEAFLNGNRCPQCFGTKKKDTDFFKVNVKSIVGEEYTVLGEYKNSKTKILMRHEKCELEWKVAPNNFLNGQRCPHCKRNKGENKITECLKARSIKFKLQFSFKDLKGFGRKSLRFDFAVLSEFNKPLFLLEYDGRQHFEPVDFAGKGEEWAIEQFKESQIKDKLKNTYCHDNNIPLYRIPYWKFNEIEEILYKLISGKQVEVDETSFLVL